MDSISLLGFRVRLVRTLFFALLYAQKTTLFSPALLEHIGDEPTKHGLPTRKHNIKPPHLTWKHYNGQREVCQAVAVCMHMEESPGPIEQDAG